MPTKEVDWRRRKFPFAFYVLGALCVLIVGGRFLTDVVGAGNPDTRDAKEMTRDYLLSRQRLSLKATGVVSDAKVDEFAEAAQCLLNRMGHPLGDSYEGEMKKTHTRESSDFFISRIDPQKPMKYIYRANTFTYVYEKRPEMVLADLNRARRDNSMKATVEWFMAGYPDFAKDYASDQEAFKAWVEKFLNSPLAPVLGIDGKPLKTWEGTDCYMLAPLARVLTVANRMAWEQKKTQINFMVCYRNDLHQAIATVSNNPLRCGATSGRSGLMYPGNSHHGMGLAADIANWGEVEDILAEFGIGCDFVEDDEGHCSFGEQATQGRLKGVVRRVTNMGKTIGKGWKTMKKGYRIYKQNK